MASSNPLALTKKLADSYFGTGTFKFMLVTSLPTESDLDNFAFRNAVPNEVANSGSYVSGGSAVSCTVGAPDAANNRTPVTFGAPATWTGATISAVGGWVYKSLGSAAADELVTFIQFSGTITSTGGNFDAAITSPLYVNR